MKRINTAKKRYGENPQYRFFNWIPNKIPKGFPRTEKDTAASIYRMPDCKPHYKRNRWLLKTKYYIIQHLPDAELNVSFIMG